MPSAETKNCCYCKQDRPFSCFYRNPKYTDGHGSTCKTCLRRNHKIWRARNPEWYPKYSQRTNLKRYGLTIEQYEQLLAQQNRRCKICGVEASDKRGRRLCVDHDHTTNTVRGLLCSNCNNGLGRFKDKPGLLFRAVDYLNGVE